MDTSDPSPDRLAFLKGLRQARQFLDKPVPPEVIDELVAMGRATGAANPSLQWQFLVIDDLVTRRALSQVGTFSDLLASVPVVIVVVLEGGAPPSKANIEGRIADRIMLGAGRHGLAGGIGWFSTGEAQEEARAILGVSHRNQVCAAIGIGYVDETTPDDDGSTLQRVRSALDRLAGMPRPRDPGEHGA